MDEEEVQQFSLRWHNHQSSLLSALSRMLGSGALADVTLCAGGTTLRAHRLVLAACSQYFAQLFRDVDCAQSSLVVVLCCEAAELRLLLTFMYTGEVTASRAALPALLKLAQTLKVSGLTAADSNPSYIPELDPPFQENNQYSPINLEFKTEQDTKFFNDTSDSNCDAKHVEDNLDKEAEVKELKSDDRLSKLDKIVQNLLSTHRIGGKAVEPVVPVSSVPEPDYQRAYRSAPSVCVVCNKRLSNQYNLRVHMETHSGRRHACRACPHVSRSRDALRKHVAYRHANAGSKV